jgi:hypothetical protein
LLLRRECRAAAPSASSTHLERFLEGPEDAGTWFAFGVQQR